MQNLELVLVPIINDVMNGDPQVLQVTFIERIIFHSTRVVKPSQVPN